MTSQYGLQTIPIHILPNISQSKVKKKMKFGQLRNITTRTSRRKILFFKNYGENETRSQVPNLFLFLKKLDMR